VNPHSGTTSSAATSTSARPAVLAELTEAIAVGRNIVLTGPAGVGKTWLARGAVAGAELAGRRAKVTFGTASARDLPLAALSPLLSGTEIAAENGVLLARAREAIAAGLAASGTTLVLVDEADLIDGLSALLLRQLVDEHGLQVILVTRNAADLPPALRNFADDDNLLRFEVQPLDVAGTTTLIEGTLGGQVSARAATRLHSLSLGNPLVLQEILRVAVANHTLRERRGVWQLEGSLPADARVAELVSLRLSALDNRGREALELVALSEPLEFDALLGFATPAVVEDLEVHRLIDVSTIGGRHMVNLAHPLYGEWLQSALPATRRRRLAAALVEIHERRNGSSPADPLRVALLRVDAGLATDPNVLLEAGRAATRHDSALAHTLLRAAVAAGGGVRARLALAEVLAVSHPAQTQELLAELATEELPGDAALAVTALSALATTLAGDDPAELWALVGDVRTAPPPIRLAAAAAYLLGGNARAAVEISVPLAVDPTLPSAARWRAALWSVAGMATTGQLDAAIELSDRTFAELGDESDAGGFDIAALWSAVILAHERRGDLYRADSLARHVLEQPGADDDDRARPRMLQCMARVAMLRGEPTVAARQMREVLADLGGADEVFTAWNLSLLAVADAMRGRPDLAAQSLREMDAAPHDLAVYRPEQEYSRAQVLACTGDLAGARAAALEAAAMASSMGQAPVALLAWSAVARYGDPRTALEGAQLAAAGVDGPLARVLCDEVEALAAGAAGELVRVGDSLAELGFRAFAAESYAAAAAAAERRGDARSGTQADERLRRTLEAGEPLAVPAASVRGAARTLTARERDVAALAGAGLADREIAQRLRVSVRTVQTHLAHVYAKTHTSGRRELAELLGPPATIPTQRVRTQSTTDAGPPYQP
jgi:DNA-binding CsgD family transcriptional regulator/type II secretory pathway predicted ATPase ExeA